MGILTGTEIDLTMLTPDPNTDPRLLPPNLRENTNTRRIEAYKAILNKAMQYYLTPEQRRMLQMLYWQGKTKTAIGNELGIGSSAVCKRIKTAESILRQHMGFIDTVYDLIVKSGDSED